PWWFPVLPRGLGFSPESSCVWRNWYCRNQSHSPWPDIDEIATVLRSPLPQRVAMRRAQNYAGSPIRRLAQIRGMAVRMFRGKESRRATGFAALAAGLLGMPAGAAAPAGAGEESHQRWAVIEQYCFDCHNTTDWAGGTAFDIMSFDNL